MISFVQDQQPRENQSQVVGRKEDDLEKPVGQWARKARIKSGQVEDVGREGLSCRGDQARGGWGCQKGGVNTPKTNM